jgi:hypothetical protein
MGVTTPIPVIKASGRLFAISPPSRCKIRRTTNLSTRARPRLCPPWASPAAPVL